MWLITISFQQVSARAAITGAGLGSRLAAGGSRLAAGGSRLLLVAGCWSRGAKKNKQISKDSTMRQGVF
jgi:hypothetical protein